MLPGATSRRLQTKAFADEWAAANLDARSASGPLWVVLGDSASQGIGATTRDASYVGVAHELLRRREAWRVVNLSRAGAGIADVLARQLPELAALTLHESAALVSCVIGVEDVARRTPGIELTVRSLLSALPSGAVVATVPLRVPGAGPVNAVIFEEAARHGLRVAELPMAAVAPGRGRDALELGDVAHAAWARALIAAVDGPVQAPAPAPAAATVEPADR
ncbi:SGNH/GDSL hydrolase family protein [Pseudonocardia sp. GCM10023141]|uniref:SGNH/GDSL hydrolase family protein n=1 Tax=Pseudonocardia sp. GCM10023141 TaxID=3252653 RepID=UPI00362112D7